LQYEVTVILCRSGRQLIADLARAAPDVVFNATEHMFGRRTADIHVPALLELLRLPYTGATPATLLLCRDKALSKSLASMVGVRVPKYALAVDERVPARLPPFPVVVKPLGQDSSEGITMRSFAATPAALARQLGVVHRRYRQGAVIESFIDGVDVYVTGIEGRTLRLRPPQELRIDARGTPARSMATYAMKHDEAYRRRWKPSARRARLPASTLRELNAAARRLWPAFRLRDYARFDFRLTPEGMLYFIEANANPGFSPASRADRWSWEEYRAAVKTVVTNALRRGG
jgi:D-alanine-D-alanine ligase